MWRPEEMQFRIGSWTIVGLVPALGILHLSRPAALFPLIPRCFRTSSWFLVLTLRQFFYVLRTLLIYCFLSCFT